VVVEFVGIGCGGFPILSSVPVQQRYNLKIWKKWHIPVKWLHLCIKHITETKSSRQNPQTTTENPWSVFSYWKSYTNFCYLVKRVIRWNLVCLSHQHIVTFFLHWKWWYIHIIYSLWL
jgi:hypothetical protein